MSRKTRKLIWSAPLVAVLAVAGALAIFVALSPQEATAHEAAMHGPPNPVSGLAAAVATGNDAMGQPAGRTQIDLTWMAPEATTENMETGASNAGLAMSYRIDYSDETRVWRNLVGGEESDATLMDAAADTDCGADAADGMRCFTDTTLKPGQLRHYRVFAVNEFGTSPVSILPTYATATSMDYSNPSAVLSLTATTTRREEIELNWQAPTDLGGGTLLFYCLAVGNNTGDIPDLTDEANQGENCLNVDEATAADDVPVYSDADTPVFTADAIVVDGDTTTFTHEGLDEPPVVSLYYRVYAVTDKDGDPDTANTTGASPVTDERRISLAASNTANGRTIEPLPTVDTSVAATPREVTNLRYVVQNGTGNTYSMRLYWTHPSNYPPPFEGTESEANPNLRANWSPQVSRWDSTLKDGDGDWDVLTNGSIANGEVEQWASDGTEVESLGDGPQEFRIRYVNDPTLTQADSGDEVEGSQVRIIVRRASAEKFNDDNLPRVVESTNNGAMGLRFRHNDQNPTTWLELDWDADQPSSNPLDPDYDDVPTSYVIDVSEDGGTTWKSLPDATDLGSTTEYTHKNVVPGKEYTYRVFPEFGGIFGLPAREDGSTRAGDLLDPVRGLKVEADGQKKLKLTWSAVQNKRGSHDIIGYLVQVAPWAVADTKDRPTTDDADWVSLAIQNDPDTGDVDESKSYSVTADTLMYTYDGKATRSSSAQDDVLAGGSIRWFRVFAINAENDGDNETGGTARSVTDGSENDPPSDNEASPNAAEYASDDWKYGMTDDPNAPGDPSTAMMPPAPVDLTAEKASNSNLLDPTDRGVFLMWNEPKEDADSITSYVIERKIDTGDWTPIGTIEWSTAQLHRERTSFTDSREYVDGEDLYYRVGSRGSSAVGATLSSEMGIKYPTTHPEGHAVVLGKPTMVTATSDEAGKITLNWEGGDNADYFILIGVDMSSVGTSNLDYDTARENDPAARMGDVTALNSGMQYLGIVVAVRGSGDSLEVEYGTATPIPIQ